MQEHGNQVEKIILNPFMTKEEARHQRNYLVLAEKIVDDRRKKKKAEKESIFHKFHLPGAGELAEEITPEEKAREALEAKRQKEREEIERKLKTEQAKIDATEESMTFPATVILETPLKLPSAGITEPPGNTSFIRLKLKISLRYFFSCISYHFSAFYEDGSL